MTIIEPHIHMYSRTTDDYAAMYREGIRVAVEPSFWLGANRRYAGTFWDYFQLILAFETGRAQRYGIDHYAAVSVNPKEADDTGLAQPAKQRVQEPRRADHHGQLQERGEQQVLELGDGGGHGGANSIGQAPRGLIPRSFGDWTLKITHCPALVRRRRGDACCMRHKPDQH